VIYRLMVSEKIRSGVPRSYRIQRSGAIVSYVYILKSQRDNSHYIGVTGDLKRRIQEHNSASVKSSRLKRPHRLIWYCVFKNKGKAYNFEKYLKSSSGYAFSKKRFL